MVFIVSEERSIDRSSHQERKEDSIRYYYIRGGRSMETFILYPI